MITDRAEIENVIKEGRKILSDRPELVDMSIHDMLNELDDGTQEMRHYRWGVAAWLVAKSIKSFEPQLLVEKLNEVDSGTLIYKYVGYLLQEEYQVNIEELILEADRCEKFDKIVKYVADNLIYEMELYEQNIPKILKMMEKYKDSSAYRIFLNNYAKHIVNMGAQCLAEKLMEDLTVQAQYEFMRFMRWGWYQKDAVEADKVIGRMLERESVWSKKVAIDFLEVSLNYGKTIFQQYFFQIENLILESEEFKEMIIPIFVKYITEISVDIEEDSKQIYHNVMRYLEKIPRDSLKIKYSFVETLHWKEEILEQLKPIFYAIISNSFDRDKRILDVLDYYLYGQLQKGSCKEVLQIMFEIFAANRYLVQYQEFFDALNSLHDGLSKYTVEVTAEALDYMLLGGAERLFFGLGLLKNSGDLMQLRNASSSFARTFNDVQIIYMMKGVLYYTIDNKRICQMAFEFLKFCKEFSNTYVEFCIGEVYSNYPETMHEVAKHYRTVKEEKQLNLAEIVIKKHENLLNERKLSYEIMDLRPSKRHQYIYHRAQMEQNRQINKMADEQSVFAQLVSRQIMKYGVRSAHVMSGKKDEKFYQVNPYVEHGYQVELPAVYIKDPVEYELKKRKYLKEVMQNAADNKGVSTSIEGER